MKKHLCASLLLLSLIGVLPGNAHGATITVTGNWTNPTTGAPATGARMERSTDGTAWTIACSVDANTTSCADVPQATGPLYRYRIVRFNAVGDAAPTPPFLINASAPDAAVGATYIFTYQP